MTDAPTRDEKMDQERLWAAIHGDDPAAFRELYRHYLPKLRHGVRSFIRRCPRLAPQEEEIVSRAWVRLLARQRKLLRSFDPRRASFGTFMAMVGANTAWQVAALKPRPAHDWHDAREDELVARLASENDVETIIADRELLAELNERLRQSLTERERQLLEDVIVWQRPSHEVAEELGIGVEAVWAATSRLRKKLAVLVTTLTQESPAAPRSVRPVVEGLLLMLAIANGELIHPSTASASEHGSWGEA